MNKQELKLHLQDTQWPLTYIDHDRNIVRAIVIDEKQNFYFVRAKRNDDFGEATLIETSGGGVDDYYNLIHRHNINNYYLCKAISFGEKHLTPDEINEFHLSTLKLSYDEALREYNRCANTRIGKLIAARELPILKQAKNLLDRKKNR